MILDWGFTMSSASFWALIQMSASHTTPRAKYGHHARISNPKYCFAANKGVLTIAQAKLIVYLCNEKNDKVAADWVAKEWTGPIKVIAQRLIQVCVLQCALCDSSDILMLGP